MNFFKILTFMFFDIFKYIFQITYEKYNIEFSSILLSEWSKF